MDNLNFEGSHLVSIYAIYLPDKAPLIITRILHFVTELNFTITIISDVSQKINSSCYNYLPTVAADAPERTAIKLIHIVDL